MRLIITRPAAQAQDAVLELRARGVDAVSLPLIGIEPLVTAAVGGRPMARGAIEASAILARCWSTLHDRRLVMFVSANAVTHFFAAAPGGSTWPARTLAACTGPATSGALRAAGVPALNIVQPPADAQRLDSEALWRPLRALPWQGASVLIVRGEAGGREWLAETLRDAGAQVEQVAAYRRTLPVLSAEGAALLVAAQASPAVFAWHLSSAEAVHNLPRLAPGGRWCESQALATHPRIAAAAHDVGFAAVQVVEPGVDALVRAWFAQQPSGASTAGPSIQSRAL